MRFFESGYSIVPQQSCTAWPMGRHVVVDEESGIVNSMLMMCDDPKDGEVLLVRRVVGINCSVFLHTSCHEESVDTIVAAWLSLDLIRNGKGSTRGTVSGKTSKESNESKDGGHWRDDDHWSGQSEWGRW